MNSYINDERARDVMQTTLETVLGASGVEFARQTEAAEHTLRFIVADMVMPLREYRITVSSSIVRRGGLHAFSMPIGDVLSLVERERDVRRWSYVDP